MTYELVSMTALSTGTTRIVHLRTTSESQAIGNFLAKASDFRANGFHVAWETDRQFVAMLQTDDIPDPTVTCTVYLTEKENENGDHLC